MKRPVAIAAVLSLVAAGARSNPLCDVAQAGLQRFAQANGWTAEVRCRALAGQPEPSEAALLAMDWPKGQALRSGALTWPVRVQLAGGHHYVQQVPMTVAWTAPAWVGTRSLATGVELGAGDLELLQRRWPDGLAIQPANAESPPSGRLRSALRAGDILTTGALLPAGTLIRGDHVVAVLAQGAMEVRLPAQLVAPGRVGENARAQVAGRTGVLEGRLIDAQTLWVRSE